ncbi:transcriptional regulator, LacI family [Roseivivax lentus]|uniref:Transcriptional regulator, LacI family n=1 Tax=Roseivivax lentus TaxID=633194 RepID=A0A1N7NFF3_9RHOB|nr:LacI family DNA-binding transcriptional regulator [Roseivivax lentus]SIS97133.1 transcriptional regulator, LacI family [Roseivivax lentus]
MTKAPEKAPHRVTLEDVARRAQTSSITVSRALRRPEMVSEKLRARIAEAVTELGYVPDPAASALASRRSNVIGVLIPSVTNSVFADVLAGLYDTIAGQPFNAQLGNTRYAPGIEDALIRVFLGQRPAGLIVTGVDQSPVSRALLEAADCPIVQIMDLGNAPIDMMVGFSHRDAARTATEHLIARGYSCPAFIGARMDPRSERRLQGFRDALAAAGITEGARVVTTTTPSSVALGETLLAQLLAQAPETDAILCNNDDLALGVQFAALRRGIAIGPELGLCGFNDLEVMAAAHPSITSVRTFRREMGKLAIEMLLARIEGRDPDAKVRDLGYALMPRDSTRRDRA